MKTLNCPNCSGQITLDDSRDFGFCSYCGTKIQINETINVKHSGQVNVEGLATVDSLIKSGFSFYDSGNENKAKEIFEKVRELSYDNIYALIGLFVCSCDWSCRGHYGSRQENDYYYGLLKKHSNEITEEEKSVINEFNCRNFTEIYLFNDDNERIKYIEKEYPSAFSLDLLTSEILDRSRNIDIVQVLLDVGMDVEEMFFHIFYKFAYYSSSPWGSERYNIFDTRILTPYTFEKCMSNGLDLKEKTVKIYGFNGTSSYELNITFEEFFTRFCSMSGYKTGYYRFEPDSPYTPQMYLVILEKYGVCKTEEKGGGCYVATAIYGSYDCPPVWTLRRYRDFNLSKSWYGRLFIKAYYAVAPKAVDLFGEKKWFNALLKNKLDRVVKFLKNKGYEDTPYEDMKW